MKTDNNFHDIERRRVLYRRKCRLDIGIISGASSQSEKWEGGFNPGLEVLIAIFFSFPIASFIRE